MSQICFIDNPPFVVDFQPFIRAKKTSPWVQKVRQIVVRPMELIGLVFIAVDQSARATVGYAWISFKHNVLGWHGSLSNYRPPKNFYVALLKVVFWALGIFWCFITTSLRLLVEQVNPPSKNFLTSYTKGQIDITHLRTKELVIDVSQIPPEVQVSTLRKFFNEINFTNPEKPGYMAPASRQEGDTTYTVHQLANSLDVFISNIECRTAFTGTPPAYDTPRLMTFYGQLENVIRFSIHKINKDIEHFFNKYGIKDYNSYGSDQQRIYKNFLETKARIALDMAIAGNYCGSRYMGEAMSTYFSLRGELEGNGTLQDDLVELLASKRHQLAHKHALQYMGSDAHAFNTYLAILGELLGIPGTLHVIEHLKKKFNYSECLKLFFEEYSVDFIIDAVQEKIKTSHLFREKIIDWLKDQVGDWSKEKENIKVQELTKQIQLIIDQEMSNTLPEEFIEFNTLIKHLRDKKVKWPSKDGFIEELFALEEARKWFEARYTDPKLRAQQKNKIKQKFMCNNTQWQQDLAQALISEQPLPLERIGKETAKQKKMDQIRKVLSIQESTLSRILEGKVSLETAIKDHLDRERQSEFLAALKLDNIATEGVSPAMLEWLLVSQEILLPQEVK